MRPVLLALCFAVLLSAVLAKDKGPPESKSSTSGVKKSGPHAEAAGPREEVKSRAYIRIRLNPQEVRPFKKPLHYSRYRYGKPKIGRPLKPRRSHHRRSLEMTSSEVQERLENPEVQERLEIPEIHEKLDREPYKIYLEPLSSQKQENRGFLGWMMGMLGEGSEKPEVGKEEPQRRRGPLIGPVRLPGLGERVYIRHVEPMGYESNHVVVHLVNRDRKLPRGTSGTPGFRTVLDSPFSTATSPSFPAPSLVTPSWQNLQLNAVGVFRPEIVGNIRNTPMFVQNSLPRPEGNYFINTGSLQPSRQPFTVHQMSPQHLPGMFGQSKMAAHASGTQLKMGHQLQELPLYPPLANAPQGLNTPVKMAPSIGKDARDVNRKPFKGFQRNQDLRTAQSQSFGSAVGTLRNGNDLLDPLLVTGRTQGTRDLSRPHRFAISSSRARNRHLEDGKKVDQRIPSTFLGGGLRVISAPKLKLPLNEKFAGGRENPKEGRSYNSIFDDGSVFQEGRSAREFLGPSRGGNVSKEVWQNIALLTSSHPWSQKSKMEPLEVTTARIFSESDVGGKSGNQSLRVENFESGVEGLDTTTTRRFVIYVTEKPTSSAILNSSTSRSSSTSSSIHNDHQIYGSNDQDAIQEFQSMRISNRTGTYQ